MKENLIDRLVYLAAENAAKHPEMKSFHAAAAIRNGGKVMCYAVNQPRTYVGGKTCYTIHAEEAVVRLVLGRNLQWAGNKWMLSKGVLWAD